MIKFLKWLFKPRNKKHILIIRHESIEWTKNDGEYLRQFLQSPTWDRVKKISEDSAIQDVFPETGKIPDNIDNMVYFVSGRRAQMTFIEKLQAEEREEKKDGGGNGMTASPWMQKRDEEKESIIQFQA